MKSCPYCGKEYTDDVTNCSIDGESLRGINPQHLIPGEPIDEALPDKSAPYLTFPDYQWSAKDAWKCLGMISVLTLMTGLILGIIIFALHPSASAWQSWKTNGYYYCLKSILSYAALLLPTVFFARTKTFATFASGFGLDCKISNYAWFGVTVALIIRCHGHFYGWGNISSYDMISFKNTASFDRYFFLVPLVLLAPFFEEVVARGFLYKAFRGSYSMEICMALIVALTIITHWPQCHHSPSATVDLSVLTVVQCYLREKSVSLWDCILSHFAFNASLLGVATLK